MIRATLIALALLFAPPAHALPPALDLDLEEHLGARLDGDLRFSDENGHPVRLADYFRDGKPVVLVLAYYRCPMLCDLVLRGVVDAARRQALALGRDYRALTVSFDPRDRPADAAQKQRALLQAANLDPARAAASWPFLVGDEREVRALADRLGFPFVRDPQSGDYAHPACAFVLTGDGRVSRYLYGVAPRPLDFRLAVDEAAGGRVGTVVDRVLLTCFRYDPASRRYGVYLSAGARVGATLTLLAVAAGYWLLLRRARGRRR